MNYIELSDNQSRVLVDIKQTYEAYRQARIAALSFTGGMSWKKVGEKEYLVRVTNRRGGNKSLGVRSPETERIHREFYDGKLRTQERMTQIESSLSEISGMSIGVGINRVPNVVADILRKFDEFGVLGKCIQVIGTNAMYGYESTAGVMFDAGLLATTDVDFMWDAKSRLKLTFQDDEVHQEGVLALLKKVDKSFEPLDRNGFRAVNKKGFFVDLVRAIPSPPWKENIPDRISVGDLNPSGIDSLKWLLASPRFKSTVIAQDGTPAPMVSPDPRAFAIHKMWLSRQNDRDPGKKNRDQKQALSVASLVKEKLHHLKFGNEAELMFPSEVRSAGIFLP